MGSLSSNVCLEALCLVLLILMLERCDGLDFFQIFEEGLADLIASVIPHELELPVSIFGMAEKCGYIDSRVACPFVR